MEWRPDAKCALEESYSEMLPLLENAAAQEEVRRRSPDARHCGLLAKRADACYECELKENPYPKGRARAVREFLNNREAVAEALELHQDLRTGLLSRHDLLQLGITEYTALVIAEEADRFRLAEYQAAIIGQQLALVLVGPGKKGKA